jgi:hypothetical protein
MRISPLLLTALLTGCGLAPMGAGKTDSGDTAAIPEGVQIPEALDFGAVALGETATDSIVIRNYTEDDVALLAGQLAGDPVFFLDSSTSFPMETAAGGEGIVTIGFTPTAEQSYAGELSLTVQGEAEPVIVAISGSGGEGGGSGGDDGGGGDGGGDGGGGAVVSASPSSLAYGGVYTNVPEALPLVISNDTESDILVTGFQFSDPGIFAWQPTEGESFNLAQVIGAGQSKSVDIWFAPDEERSYSETLTIETDAGNISVPVSGTGEEPLCQICDPDLVVTTNGSDAYSMELSTLVTTANIVLRNASDVDLTISALDLNNGAGGGDFVLSGLSPQVIPPQSSISGTLSYTCPSSESPCFEVPDTLFGTGANTLTITSDDLYEPTYQIGLSAILVF